MVWEAPARRDMEGGKFTILVDSRLAACWRNGVYHQTKAAKACCRFLAEITEVSVALLAIRQRPHAADMVH